MRKYGPKQAKICKNSYLKPKFAEICSNAGSFFLKFLARIWIWRNIQIHKNPCPRVIKHSTISKFKMPTKYIR